MNKMNQAAAVISTFAIFLAGAGYAQTQTAKPGVPFRYLDQNGRRQSVTLGVDATQAQIEDGPQAGKEVAVDGNLILMRDVFATLHGNFLTNANSPHAIP